MYFILINFKKSENPFRMSCMFSAERNIISFNEIDGCQEDEHGDSE